MYNGGYVSAKNAIQIIENMKKLKYHTRRGDVAKLNVSTTAGELSALTVVDSDREAYRALKQASDTYLQEGVRWLRAASEHGVADAAFQLGRLYEQVHLNVPWLLSMLCSTITLTWSLSMLCSTILHAFSAVYILWVTEPVLCFARWYLLVSCCAERNRP